MTKLVPCAGLGLVEAVEQMMGEEIVVRGVRRGGIGWVWSWGSGPGAGLGFCVRILMKS
jgi:hypothetical protein